MNFHKIAAGSKQVIAGGAGFNLGIHRFVGFKSVDDNLASMFFFEALQQLRLEIIRPGIDLQFRSLAAAAQRHQAKKNSDRTIKDRIFMKPPWLTSG